MNFKRLTGTILSFLVFCNSMCSAMVTNEEHIHQENEDSVVSENDSNGLSLVEKIFVGTGAVVTLGSLLIAGGNKLNQYLSQRQGINTSNNPTDANEPPAVLPIPDVPPDHPPSRTHSPIIPLSKNYTKPNLLQTSFSLELNRNIHNTKNLCYYDSLIQQLYSLVPFRKFLNETNPKDLPPDLSEKLTLFKDLFSKMADYDKNTPWIEKEYFENFAKNTLGNIGDQGTIFDVLDKNDFVKFFMKSRNFTILFIFKEQLNNFVETGVLRDDQGRQIDPRPVDNQFTFLIVDALSDDFDLNTGELPRVTFQGNTYVPTAITAYDGTDDGQFGHYLTYKLGAFGGGLLWDIYDGLNHNGIGSHHWLTDYSPMPNIIPNSKFYDFVSKNCAMITFTNTKLLPTLAQ